MPAGLIIYNTSSTVQIDQDWRNFGFKQKISEYFSIFLPNVNPTLTYTLVIPGEKAMVAVKASTFRVVMMNSWFDGTNYTYNFYLIPPTTTGLVEEVVDFYVFDVLPVTGHSTVGLAVYDAAGNVVFHSDMKPMKIGNYQAASVPFTGTPGRTYVPMIGVNPLRTDGGRIRAYALMVAAHEIFPIDVLTPKFTISSWANAGTYAAVDVTGL